MTDKEKAQIKNIIEHSKRKANDTPLTFYDIQHPDRNNMINELCDYFKKDNPNFNEMKFKNYIKEGK